MSPNAFERTPRTMREALGRGFGVCIYQLVLDGNYRCAEQEASTSGSAGQPSALYLIVRLELTQEQQARGGVLVLA